MKLKHILSILLLIPISTQAQYYDLTVGTERHYDSESYLDVFTRVATSEYSVWGVERVIGEQVIDETTWAVVEWVQWNWLYQPSGTSLILNRDTVLYRLTGTTLIQLKNGETEPVFDFDFAIGDSMYAKTKSYLPEWVRSSFQELGDVGGTVILDADILFPDENTYRILWGDGSSSDQFEHPIPSADVFLNEILTEKEGWLFPHNTAKSTLYTPILPFFYVEGIGSLYNIFNHRGLYMSGYKSAAGDVMGRMHAVPVSISRSDRPDSPNTTSLLPNYPNPFNPSTVVSYRLSVFGNVQIHVMNVLGQRVATLVDGIQTPGEYSVTFDAVGMSSGIYIVVLESDGIRDMRKVTLVK
jgi:hypothetical protein